MPCTGPQLSSSPAKVSLLVSPSLPSSHTHLSLSPSASLSVSTEVDRTLLYSLCQLPVKQFTELAIAIAVDCWQWLIASRPDLEYMVKGRTIEKPCDVNMGVVLADAGVCCCVEVDG